MPTGTVRRSTSQRTTKTNRLSVAPSTSSVRRSNSFSLLARPSRPGDRLTVENLHSLSPFDKTGSDVVSSAIRIHLLNIIKMDPVVHDVFFPYEIEDPKMEQFDTRGFPVDKLVTALVAQVIANNKDPYKFHSMIDKSALEDVFKGIYNSIHWKKIGNFRI